MTLHERVAQSLLSATLLLVAACASAPRPCVTSNECPGSLSCQVGRCAPLSVLPTSAEATRALLSPEALTYVDATSSESTPAELRLGSAAGEGSTLLLRFASIDAKRIDSAFLLLFPAPDAPPSSDLIDVSVSAILEPWSSTLERAPLPLTRAPEARARVSFSAPHVVRVDVTEMLRARLDAGLPFYGFAIHAAGADGTGARFSTAQHDGNEPKLDVYTH